MKPLRHPLTAVLLIGLVAPAGALTPIDLDRLQRTKERIDYLYLPRTATPPPINPRHNPFRIGSEPLPDSSGQTDGEVIVASEEELLLQAAATLKISGVLETGGQMRLAINTVNYAEGDVIQVRLATGRVFLRVTTITAGSVTLQLGEARHTLRF